MARMTRTTAPRAPRPSAAEAAGISPEARQHMIDEAAYYRSAHRGFAPGHEMEDWLAAEAEVEHALRRKQAASGRHTSESATILEFGMQGGGSGRGPAEDDVLKRTLKQHPRRDISRVESMEPEDAPLKE